jgi:hypothetical protein
MPATFKLQAEVKSHDEERRLVFGWANISITKDGKIVTDSHNHQIQVSDLENAAYGFVLNFRETGDMHKGDSKGQLVESMVFSEEKTIALGIPEGTLPQGWWVGFYIEDDKVWKMVKNGDRPMFSIEGTARKEPVEDG